MTGALQAQTKVPPLPRRVCVSDTSLISGVPVFLNTMSWEFLRSVTFVSCSVTTIFHDRMMAITTVRDRFCDVTNHLFATLRKYIANTSAC